MCAEIYSEANPTANRPQQRYLLSSCVLVCCCWVCLCPLVALLLMPRVVSSELSSMTVCKLIVDMTKGVSRVSRIVFRIASSQSQCPGAAVSSSSSFLLFSARTLATSDVISVSSEFGEVFSITWKTKATKLSISMMCLTLDLKCEFCSCDQTKRLAIDNFSEA